MEIYIKNNNLGDITYQSELIPPFWVDNAAFNKTKRAGLIRAKQLMFVVTP